MAYGRLDIFFPDGMFRTFLLTTSPVSIGRSPGNVIALDTETISRYHISLTHADGMVTLTDHDSANGTFVEGERMKEEVPRPLYGGEEILIGDLRIIFHNLDENPTRPVSVPEDEQTSRRVEREDVPFRLDVDGPTQAIPPGAHISAALTITNTGSAAEHYLIEVEGLPKGWTRLDQAEVDVQGGSAAAVVISFKPIRRHDSAPGEYNGKITVRARTRPDAPLGCPVRLRVLPFSGFGMALAQRTLDTSGRFRLYVQNQGSAPLPITLTGRDLSQRLRFELPMHAMTLAPGQRASIDGRARPRQTMIFGEPRTFPFDLIVRSCDNAGFLVATRGYATEKPLLPTWAGFAAIGITISILALVLLALLIVLRPAPPPQIAQFRIDAARVARGTPVAVLWEFENGAHSADLFADGTLLFTEATPVRAGAYIVDTTALAGDVDLRLRAYNTSGTAEAEQALFVYAPLAVTLFEVQPASLVRYVAQTVSIQWSVSGAISTRLSGLDGWSTTPLQSSYAGSAQVEIVGIPLEPVELVLNAESAEREELEYTHSIAVIDPECTVTQANTQLYTGPDPVHQVVSTPTEGTVLVVTARDASGVWLRVRLSGGALAWGERAAFVCADTFNPDDLLIALDIPPTPTPLPSLTAAPTVTPSTERGSASSAATPTTAG